MWGWLSDKRRLLLSFGLIIVLSVSTGALTLYGLFSLGSFARTIYNHPPVMSNASLRAALHIKKIEYRDS